MLTTRPIFYTLCKRYSCHIVSMSSARAWGDEGHETIALIAEHYLTPAAKAQVDALLGADTLNTLTAHDIASEATWADKYRSTAAQPKHRLWHYADIEVSTGDVAAASFDSRSFPRENLLQAALRRTVSSPKLTSSKPNSSTPRRRDAAGREGVGSKITSCILLAMCISPSIRQMKTTGAATTS